MRRFRSGAFFSHRFLIHHLIEIGVKSMNQLLG